MEKHIIFLGYAIDKETAKNTTGVSIAGNKYQLNVLEQLDKNGYIVHPITVFPTASYPRGPILIHDHDIELIGNLKGKCVGFLNIKILKQIIQAISVYKEARKILCQYPQACIMTFNVFAQVALPTRWLKKFVKGSVILIFADAPIPQEQIGMVRKFFYKIANRQFSIFDRVIALNEYAVQKFIPNKPYIIVEGGIRKKEVLPIGERKVCSQEKHVLYAGALTEYSGIINLIDAVTMLKSKDVVLDIYGSGPLAEYIIRKSESVRNIVFHGSIDNEMVLQKQQEAFLLINPRPVDDPVVMCTFPSKIFEYLSSGTPVLATEIGAFSQEYYKYMFTVKDNTPSVLAGKIDEIANMDAKTLGEKAFDAYGFVTEKKNWDVQGRRIAEFLKLIS